MVFEWSIFHAAFKPIRSLYEIPVRNSNFVFLQYLNDCDEVILLKDGRIAEIGSYDKLMQDEKVPFISTKWKKFFKYFFDRIQQAIYDLMFYRLRKLFLKI